MDGKQLHEMEQRIADPRSVAELAQDAAVLLAEVRNLTRSGTTDEVALQAIEDGFVADTDLNGEGGVPLGRAEAEYLAFRAMQSLSDAGFTIVGGAPRQDR